MTKLAIIDLDGIIADNTARFAKAEEAKQAFLNDAQVRMGEPASAASVTKQATDIYWRAVFNPEYVPLDTLIDGAEEALYHLQEEASYSIVLLTSRPESMRQATIAWIGEHLEDLLPRELIMKPPAAQYVKTITWKALTIQMLVALYGADDVLVVDDEPANLAELAKYDTSHMCLCASLAEAIAPEPEMSEDHPF